jgi:Concanavalin A-like lectin/glucanases superfamily
MNDRMKLLSIVLIICILNSALQADADSNLIGHWKLNGNSNDESFNHLNGVNHNTDLNVAGRTGKSAGFNGRNSYLSVPHHNVLKFGTKDFAISTWIHTDENLDDSLGDILSKFDPVTRKGFTLTIKNHAGSTSSQANYRHLSFGIDNAKIDEKWTDCGRPGNSIIPFAICVFKNELYAGTCEPAPEDAGRVFKYAGGQKWIDCGSPFPSNAVSCLAVYNGELYAGVTKYRLRGSSLAESKNDTRGGHVFRYAGNKKWIPCGKPGQGQGLNGMVVFRNKLYVSEIYSPGFYRYEGGTNWTNCGSPNGKRMESMTVFNGNIYTTGYDDGAIYRYDGGESWKTIGKLEGVTQTYAFATYEGKLHVSTWPDGSVYRYEEENKWTNLGRFDQEKEVMGLGVYNGKLYGGTLPLAKVFRFDGTNNWTDTGQLDTTPDVRYRRSWNMAVFKGKLYSGVLPSGKVYSLEAGKNVTYDTALKPGWRHIVAQKTGNHLELYVDGKKVAESSQFNPQYFDITNDKPLKIGFGSHDYFNGKISDLRIYQSALSQKEIDKLAQ